MTRTFILHSPLDDDQLQFVHMQGVEALSTVSQFDLICVSPSDSIEATDLLGQSVTIEMATQYDSPRYLNSIITQFAYIGPDSSAKRLHRYKATLHSWLYLADKQSDCKIYQNKGVDTIIKEALQDIGLPFEMKLMDSYPPREYTVQFNETTLNFVKRLAEEVGIYFYTKHALGSHTICFTDGGHTTLPDYSKLPFLTPGLRPMDIDENVSEWHIEYQVLSGRYVTNSYNFKTPDAKLQKIEALPKDHSHDAMEVYEWHGRYPDTGEGAALARVRREQQQLDFQTISAKSNVRGIAPGYYFKLTDHPVASNNAEYLIVSANYDFQENMNVDDGKETTWSVDFTVKPSNDRYQPPRVSAKPRIVGPQSAKVSGPAGAELWCDAYGRVKVQFPWDRYGKNDENSSCWIRVSSPWAGSNFGGMHVPRIGQEVIVEHLNGDADHPVITGRVFNQNQMPPWDLPANATQSGFLSRSSPGGAYGNANAIRFEDKKGAEQVWIQAERNMDTVVEHDETHHVMHDRTKTIDHDETVFVHHNRTETVDNNETITVHNNRQERVDHNETISIGDNRTEDVGKNETLTVGINRSEHIGANETVVIGGMKSETVALAKAETIGLAKALSIGAAYAVTVGGAMNTAVGLAQFEEVGMDKSINVVKSFTTKAGTTYAVQAGGDSGSKINMDGESITLVIGKSSITMNKSGEITISGEKINLVGSDSINFTSPNINNN